MPIKNRQVLLASRPMGIPKVENFRVAENEVPSLVSGQILLENHYVSLDAGFRNWMNEGSGDDVLPEMQVDRPVMGLTLGQVIDSKLSEYAPGEWLMVRKAWEEYSVLDASHFISRLPEDRECPLSYYLGILGDTGLSAYFGLLDFGRPLKGQTVLVSAAGGAVGNVAGQIARIMGARSVGICGSKTKIDRLVDELGFDAAINYRMDDLDQSIKKACPNGIDVYFDNVGGPLLEVVLDNIAVGARIVLCGSIISYNALEPVRGPSNLFQLTARQATMQGFMTHLQETRYEEARKEITGWVKSGVLRNAEYRLTGINKVGQAFCDLFSGKNFGKTIVALKNSKEA